MAVLGDLHLEPAHMHLFEEARSQLRAAMPDAARSRVVQLGDLGGYRDAPGSLACFRTAADYMNGFKVPYRLITGNHDLEGAEFQDDESNLAAWRETFGQNHYWAQRVGSLLAIGLSTVRFRSNTHSVHEVHIDDQQLEWFEATLEANRGVPVAVFTHAPPIGSGLRVVERVHVKNRCAWLNHSSSNAGRFVQLCEKYPNVALWFSGHFHLSQNYLDSISVVGRCAFVQTGVIGECHRDGNRQSRLLRFDDHGYELFTVDHVAGGRLRLDMQHQWASQEQPQRVTPEHELVPDPRAGWLTSRLDCGITESADEEAGGAVEWLPAGANVMLAVQDDLLVEFDMARRAPIGVVAFLEGRRVSMVTAAGGAPDPLGDGSDVAAVVLTDRSGESVRLLRNEAGSFYRVFQPNKWRLKQQEAMAASAAAMSEQRETATVQA